MRKLALIILVLVASLLLVIPALAARSDQAFGEKTEVTVYVAGQGLFYDSIVGPDLPAEGPFQQLEMGPNGLQTEFGPGDDGYLGGRWWMDTNDNGEMDAGDHYFSCPLLGPGRESP
jgi:hypothetical protein